MKIETDTSAAKVPHYSIFDRTPMSDANFLLLATRSRTCAEEILARAEAVIDADARQEMRETAAAYEGLAAQLEKELVGMARRPRARSHFDSVRAGIGTALRSLHSEVFRERLPDRIAELLRQLDEQLRRLDEDA